MIADLFTDEATLWRAFQQGDQKAFAALYSQFIRPLLGYGRKLSPNAALVEDTVHDLFMELWHSRGRLSDTTSIRFYLFRALRNKLSHSLPLIPLVPVEDNSAIELPVESYWIGEEESAEQLHRLRQAMSQLSRRQQEAIHLRYFQLFNNQQVADLMQLNEQSVRNLIHTALRSLRHILVSGLIGWLLFCPG